VITDVLNWIDRHPARAGTLAGWYQQVCGLIAAVVAVPLVIRLLPPGEAGLWFFFQSILGILQLTDFGFTLVLSRQIAFSITARNPTTDANTDFLDIRPGWDGISDVYTLTRRIFRWICGIGLTVMAVLYHAVIPAGRILEHRTTETAVSWYVLGLSTLLIIQAKPHQALLDGMAKVYLTRMLTGTQQLLSGLGVVAVLMSGGRFIHMALAVLATAVLSYLGTRWCVHRVASLRLTRPMPISRNHLVKFLRVAAPLGILSLSAFMVMSVQVPLVGFILGSAAVPAYYLAQRIASVLNLVCLQFMLPQLPLFTQEIGARRFAEATHRMRQTLTLTTVLFIAANIAFYAASPTLADWWVGPGRYLYGLPLLILAIDSCLMNSTGAWGSFVLARGNNPFVWSTLLSGLLTVSLCLALGQRFGLLGITTASLLAGLCTNYWFVPFRGLRLLGNMKHRMSGAA
jgi:O-antigen/teichoic acid export membrane protein